MKKLWPLLLVLPVVYFWDILLKQLLRPLLALSDFAFGSVVILLGLAMVFFVIRKLYSALRARNRPHGPASTH